jgi:uncharacterized protein (TIGR03905 family)
MEMKKVKFIPLNVCSKEINFEIIDGKISNLEFVRGCSGNAKGISMLIEGMDAVEAMNRLKGIRCQGETSCPDQLSNAISQAMGIEN